MSFGATAQEDPVHQIARAYLDALTGTGDDAAREALLGGVTMNASIATIGSWKIIAEDPVRKETGALQTAGQLMADLDRSGRATLANLLTQSGAVGNDVEVRELSEAEANRLLAPTRDRASRFVRTLPVRLAHELPHVHHPGTAHVGVARVADVGVVLPHDRLRASGA